MFEGEIEEQALLRCQPRVEPGGNRGAGDGEREMIGGETFRRSAIGVARYLIEQDDSGERGRPVSGEMLGRQRAQRLPPVDEPLAYCRIEIGPAAEPVALAMGIELEGEQLSGPIGG